MRNLHPTADPLVQSHLDDDEFEPRGPTNGCLMSWPLSVRF